MNLRRSSISSSWYFSMLRRIERFRVGNKVYIFSIAGLARVVSVQWVFACTEHVRRKLEKRAISPKCAPFLRISMHFCSWRLRLLSAWPWLCSPAAESSISEVSLVPFTSSLLYIALNSLSFYRASSLLSKASCCLLLPFLNFILLLLLSPLPVEAVDCRGAALVSILRLCRRLAGYLSWSWARLNWSVSCMIFLTDWCMRVVRVACSCATFTVWF